MDQPILVTKADGYHIVTFNRPEKLNAFTERMNLDIQAALEAADADPVCRAILITANGRAFTAGQDLSAAKAGGVGSTKDTLDRLYNPIVMRIAQFRMPVVCAVNGIAAGAGLNVALGCDIVLAGRSAKFMQPFSKIALVPDAGGTWFLPRLVGPARARGLALLADTITAEQAQRMGLIWQVVDDDKLLDEAKAMTYRLAQGPTRAYAAIKHALHAAEGNSLQQQLDLERDLQVQLAAEPDNREGTMAFLEKRAPLAMSRGVRPMLCGPRIAPAGISTCASIMSRREKPHSRCLSSTR
jgi:2-(1,2-epoxy-1,2-dihydrophenyl)acetyl-CoA isomerase